MTANTQSLITKNSVVTLSYQLKDSEGKIIDSSETAEPMVYIQGSQDILQGIEDAVEGLAVDASTSVTIEAKDAYGEYEAELVTRLPISAFAGIDDLAPGMQLQEETDDGPMIVTIKEVSETEVLLDANHPMSGQDLHFDLKVVAIREASASELDHGHVHTEGHSH